MNFFLANDSLYVNNGKNEKCLELAKEYICVFFSKQIINNYPKRRGERKNSLFPSNLQSQDLEAEECALPMIKKGPKTRLSSDRANPRSGRPTEPNGHRISQAANSQFVQRSQLSQDDSGATASSHSTESRQQTAETITKEVQDQPKECNLTSTGPSSREEQVATSQLLSLTPSLTLSSAVTRSVGTNYK